MTAPSGPGLDPVLQNQTRLTVLAFLSGCQQAEFGAVRDHCGVSDATLSKNVSILEQAGYVKVKKGYLGKFPRTWLAGTRKGRSALEAHLAALHAIVETAQRAGAAAERDTPTTFRA
jgi:DNA-binding MarR family transcriptional regulator